MVAVTLAAAQVHGELEAAIQRCEESVTVALRNAPTDPELLMRLVPTIGLPITLLYMSTLLVRAAELSLARTERVRLKEQFILSGSRSRRPRRVTVTARCRLGSERRVAPAFFTHVFPDSTRGRAGWCVQHGKEMTRTASFFAL